MLSANALHDSVIEFAYALNKSLPETESGSLGCNVTDSIHSYLQLVNFSGAGDEISFTSRAEC